MMAATFAHDRYRVTGELDHTGAATVYRADDRILGRVVAVKVLSAEVSAWLGTARFRAAVHEMTRLVHPNIVPVFDSGVANGRFFYVMPFVEGDTLRTKLRREGIIGADEAAAILADVGEALAYAEGQGAVHGVIKPENIFCFAGRAMVTDFGMAAQLIGAPAVAGENASFVGASPYMSPELSASPASADARSDLYALGCVAFEMLTGDRPYPGPSPAEFVVQHSAVPVPRVRSKAPTTPSRIAELAERMMAKSAAARPSSAVEFLATVRTVADEREMAASDEMPAVRPAEPVAAPAHDARYDAGSMEACREGRVLFHRSYQGGPGAREKLEYARALFQRARELDPKNPYALVGLADVMQVMGARGFEDFGSAVRTATEFRTEALKLDPSLSELHVSIAVDLLYAKDDFETAGAEYRKAMASGRVRPDALRLYAAYLKMAGKPQDALRHARIAVAGDPAAPAAQVGLADVLMAMGRYVEALPPLREALRLSPGYESALERLDITSARLGRHDEAAEARRALHGVRQRPDRIDAFDADVARLGARQARTEDLRRDLDAFLERVTTEDPFHDVNVSRQLADQIIIAYAELGEWARAMDWVERGFYRRPGRLRRVLTDMPFDRRGLAADPRYARLLATAGLEALL